MGFLSSIIIRAAICLLSCTTAPVNPSTDITPAHVCTHNMPQLSLSTISVNIPPLPQPDASAYFIITLIEVFPRSTGELSQTLPAAFALHHPRDDSQGLRQCGEASVIYGYVERAGMRRSLAFLVVWMLLYISSPLAATRPNRAYETPAPVRGGLARNRTPAQ